MDRLAWGSASMASRGALPLLCGVVYLLCTSASGINETGPRPLRQGFYSETCPRAEEIVRQVVTLGVLADLGLAAGLVRLHFHDCFVRGCDASVLLDATPTGEPVEKDSRANANSLRGMEIIDNAKQRLESECPGTVSCADILAFAARDAAVFSGLPSYDVPAGRRDGRTSRATDTRGNLPSPKYHVDNITSIFAAKGFTQREMVTLIGAHSIGSARCSVFDYRLYSFQPGQPQDPTMHPLYALSLKLQCLEPGSALGTMLGDRRVLFKPASPLRLDARFYADLLNGRGLLESDQALVGDATTRWMVSDMAAHPVRWAQEFGRAMAKLGMVEVLTGEEGEVRRSCRSVN